MKYNYILSLFFILVSLSGVASAIDIDQPYVDSYNLNSANTVYYLLNDTIGNSTAFVVGANNVTVEGNGKTVTFAVTSTGTCFDNTNGYLNFTLNNTNISQTNATFTTCDAIIVNNDGLYFTITNNTINTKGVGMDIDDYSNNATIAYNTITSVGRGICGVRFQNSNIFNNVFTYSATSGYAIELQVTSNNNYFRNNTITSTGSDGYPVRLYNSNSYFIDTIVSTARSDTSHFHLRDLSTWYSRNSTSASGIIGYYAYDAITPTRQTEDGIVYVKSVGNSGKPIKRKTHSWNSTLYHFNDTIVLNKDMTYNVSGLTPNTDYIVKIIGNTSTITTDGSGNLGFLHTLIANVDTGIQIYLSPEPSFDIVDIYKNRDNESYNWIFELSNYSASLNNLSILWAETENGNTYYLKFWNDTEISSQTATSDNETLWFNHTVTEIPEGKYYISETSVTIETFVVAVGAFAAVVVAGAAVVSRRVRRGISGFWNRRVRRR